MSPEQCEAVSVFFMGPTEAGIELFAYDRDTQESISQQARRKNRPQPLFRQQICRKTHCAWNVSNVWSHSDEYTELQIFVKGEKEKPKAQVLCAMKTV